jgi:hypothetical protein
MAWHVEGERGNHIVSVLKLARLRETTVALACHLPDQALMPARWIARVDHRSDNPGFIVVHQQADLIVKTRPTS